MASDKKGKSGNGDRLLYCSFCGKSQHEVRKLIAGPSVFICDECVDLCNDIIREEIREKSGSGSASRLPTPHEIDRILNDYAVGQFHAKKVLSVAVYNHYKRLDSGDKSGSKVDEVELSKSNVLLIGPTGCGKTLLAETLARLLNVPFTIADATTLTEAGYVGEGCREHHPEASSEVRLRCGEGADGDRVHRRDRQDLAKVGQPVHHPGRVGRGGSASAAQAHRGNGWRRCPRKAGASILNRSSFRSIRRTSCSSAAVRSTGSTRSSNAGRRSTAGIGFGADVKSKDDAKKVGEILKEVEPEDLIHYGLIPEFVGRLAIFATLEELDEEQLVQILTEPKNALVKQYKRLFQMENTEIEFREDALRCIARKAMERKTGARGLRSILEHVLLDTMYHLPSMDGVAKVVVDESAIEGDSDPLLIYEGDRQRVAPG